MPADLDQFRREYSHGAVIGGIGLVKLGHMAANGRSLLNQINLKARSGKIKGGLNTADPPTDNHDVSKIAVCGTYKKISFNWFFFHFSMSSSGLFGALNHFLDNLRDVLNLYDFTILQG